VTEASSSDLRRRSILIVEDEYLIAADLARSLEDFGAAVIGPASRVKEALALLDAAPHVDAAVLDVDLQGEQVYPVAEALRTRSIPFVFATGYRGEAVASEYARVPRLEKPIDPEALAEALGKRADVGGRGSDVRRQNIT